MGLRFEHVFTVKAPPDQVWAYLTDPYRVAPALPGAAVTEKVDDRTFKGTITVKVGPVSAKYRGSAHFDLLDASARTMEMTGSAQDVTGRGGAELKMKSRLTGKGPNETEVSVDTETNVTGILAQFGRGMIQEVSNQMFQRFTEAVRAELEQPAAMAAEVEAPGAAEAGVPAAPPAAPAPAPPIEVVSFGTRIAGQMARRAFAQAWFWIVAVLALIAALWFWTR